MPDSLHFVSAAAWQGVKCKTMIRHIFVIFVSMLLLIVAGTIGLYKLVGTFSGQDAICLSGIFAGILIGVWYGKAKGLGAINSIMLCATLLSIPLVGLSLVMSHANQDYVESLAYFSIGFSLLSSYVLGLGWGKHLTSVAT